MMSKIWRAISGAKPERGLVEQEQTRPAHQRAGDGEHLLLAARQRAAALGEPLARAAETARARGRGRREVAATPAASAPICRFSSTVMRGKMRRPSGAWAMWSRAISWVGSRVMSRPAKTIAAFARARIAADRHHQGRLAGAVRADQRDDLALADLEVDALERDDVAVDRPSRRARERSGAAHSADLRLDLRRPPRPRRRDRRR